MASPPLVVGTTLLTVAVLGGLWLLAGKRHRFAYWIGRTTTHELRAQLPPDWQPIELDVAPDVRLVGLRRAPRTPDGRWILFLPGNSTSQLLGFRAVLDGLEPPPDRGFVLFAYRGFDASTGVPTPAALASDALAQWDFCVRELRIPPDRLEVWGYSLGGMLAVPLAAALQERGTPPRRLVLLATADRMTLRPQGLLGRFQAGDVYETTAAAAAITGDVVVLHGRRDDAVPIDQARRLQAAFGAAARVTFRELPAQDHLTVFDGARALLRD